jgi:hypothetical protein
MTMYTVLYYEEHHDREANPLAFVCAADDEEHAEEQCLDAYPGCDTVYVVESEDQEEILAQYWDEGEDVLDEE